MWADFYIRCFIRVEADEARGVVFRRQRFHACLAQGSGERDGSLPLVVKITEGKKEEELVDLEAAISEAQNQFGIEGIVTGAVESVYQAERIQRICQRLDLWCFNPLWKKNQQALLEEMLEKGFRVLISGIFAYPLDEKWLGKEIAPETIRRLVELQHEYGISPSGEGGEIETTVLDAPMFKRSWCPNDSGHRHEPQEGLAWLLRVRLANPRNRGRL